MASIFSKIANREIPAHIVAEDDDFLAFLDVNPLKQGHTLVIPKQEVDYLFDADDKMLSAILPFAKQIAKSIEKVIPCERVGVAVVGLEVPHAHIHLIPINSVEDMNFKKTKGSPTQEELAMVAEKIRTA